jgi:transposase
MSRKSFKYRIYLSNPVCGLVMDRDENAARNILQRGLLALRQ